MLCVNNIFMIFNLAATILWFFPAPSYHWPCTSCKFIRIVIIAVIVTSHQILHPLFSLRGEGQWFRKQINYIWWRQMKWWMMNGFQSEFIFGMVAYSNGKLVFLFWRRQVTDTHTDTHARAHSHTFLHKHTGAHTHTHTLTHKYLVTPFQKVFL